MYVRNVQYRANCTFTHVACPEMFAVIVHSYKVALNISDFLWNFLAYSYNINISCYIPVMILYE